MVVLLLIRVVLGCVEPPTEYRMLIKEDMSKYQLSELRIAPAQGKPLHPEWK